MIGASGTLPYLRSLLLPLIVIAVSVIGASSNRALRLGQVHNRLILVQFSKGVDVVFLLLLVVLLVVTSHERFQVLTLELFLPPSNRTGIP